MMGQEAFFLTGTDENATKVLEAAQRAGQDPMAFVDRVSEAFRTCWASLDLRYDDFIRTTEPRHKECAQKFFSLLQEKGHIYLDKYEGWYDVSSETFFREADLVDGKSPDGNEVRWVSEENYFFRLSAFGDALLEHIESHPGFIVPEVRKNEVVAFVRQGLRDMCVSRNNQGWGIPVPGDESKVIYVWFEALINYLAATGWPEEGWEQLWPASAQWMAKDILTRFHATLWPAMLMGVGLPLPETLVGHAYLLFNDSKMSKSKGNVVSPQELVDGICARSGCAPQIGIDAVRYALAVTLPFENDSSFSVDELDRRYNSDLANDLGNALNRTLAMTHKFAGGTIPAGESEAKGLDAIRAAIAGYLAALELHRVDHAAEQAIGLIRWLNKYIDERSPWALAKQGDPALPAVLRTMLLVLRSAEGLIRPYMPHASAGIAAQLRLDPVNWSELGSEASLPSGQALAEPQPIFPRIDPKKAMAVTDPPQPVAERPDDIISIDDFAKIKLRVARVLEAEVVPDSDKLLKLQLMVGDEKRQVLAGIRKSYEPKDLIGRQVIVVANLAPRKMRGTESQGMILAADGPDGTAILLTPEQEAPEGTSVH
ncbi:MAG: Methionine--tRNA ligase [Fimbriimonadaceae bacterium]|nr:Methionine--tRNA ligase [Fimbriimonadaceae bacterium]